MQTTKEFYDKRGALVLESGELPKVSSHFEAPYDYLYKLINKSKNKLNILEVGSGTGLHIFELAKNGHQCTGVDISDLSVQSAKDMSGKLGFNDRVKFVLGSYDQVLKVDEKFDVIFTSGTLYYLNISEFISFLKRHLKNTSHKSTSKCTPNNSAIQKDTEKGFAKISTEEAEYDCISDGQFICVETNGSNYLLNAYRWVRNKRTQYRDESTLKNLIRTKDLLLFYKEFKTVRIRYFDFLTLLCVKLPEGSLVKKSLLKIFRKLDYFILNKLRFHFLAFKFVLQVKLDRLN